MNSSLLQFFMPQTAGETADDCCEIPSAYNTPSDLPQVTVDPTLPSTEFSPETPIEYSNPIEIRDIYISIDSFDQAVTNVNNEMADFDIIFNVFWTEESPTGESQKSGKVRRRISVNKEKLRLEASPSISTVVESDTTKQIAEEKEKLMNSIRVLAGVAGNKTFV